MANEDTEKIKSKIRERYKGKNIESIEKIAAEVPKKLSEDTSTKRVAVYARVSTDNVEQTSSYELQRNYYEDYVSKHPGWELVGIYADEGISGTSLQHRDEFVRMIQDCKDGKIDLILTKNVSRLSRNILHCIKYVRELRDLPKPVGILFETENIYTLDKNIEMMLTFMATFAQEESHTKSEIMNASIEQRFSRGIFLTPVLLGFDKDEDGNLVINEEEAETVKMCFFMYIEGYSTLEIAHTLNKYARKSKAGNVKWTRGAVANLLRNERYCGDILSRKTYTPNFLDHKSKKNKKNRNQYYLQNHHEAIVNRIIFNIANKILSYNTMAKKRRPVPQLEVVEQGILNGFVPVARSWSGFLLQDYTNATRRVHIDLSEVKNERRRLVRKFRGYQIAREQLFSTRERPSVLVSNTSISFNSGCIRKFSGIEYVELLFNAEERQIAVVPCKPFDMNAINWTKIEDGRPRAVVRSCRAFSRTLFEHMDWDPDNKYKLRGQYLQKNDTQLLVFWLDEPEIIINLGNRRSRIELGGGLASSFGPSYATYAVQQSLFEEYEDYSAVPVLIEGQEILTEEDMLEIKAAKEIILEKWREQLNEQ